jgi:hypothetical protein
MRVLLLLLVILAACGGKPVPRAPEVSPVEVYRVHERAMAAYRAGDHATCAELMAKVAAATPWATTRAEAYWGVASCRALAGDAAAGVEAMRAAAAAGLRDLDDVEGDADLASLAGQPGYDEVLAAIAANAERFAASTHPELRRLHHEDQADRQGGFDAIDWKVVSERDRARRAEVDRLIADGAATTADDYFHAAMVYQHGEQVAEIERARELARRAAELDPGHGRARWLAAAAEDRALMYQGKPQRWGTQMRRDGDGPWVVYEVAGDLTDEQRAAENVPPLDVMEARAAAMTSPQGAR